MKLHTTFRIGGPADVYAEPESAEELMELIGMSDRIIIMKDGKMSTELLRDPNMDENSLIASMV